MCVWDVEENKVFCLQYGKWNRFGRNSRRYVTRCGKLFTIEAVIKGAPIGERGHIEEWGYG